MKMKIILLTGLMTIMAFTLGTTGVLAGDDHPSASADIAIFNQYIWRGFELSKGSAVIQPSISLGYKGLGLNAWGNLDTNLDPALDNGLERDEAKWNETDFTVSYEASAGPVLLGAGFIYYALDGMDDSRELYVTAGYDTLLSPTLTIYREIAHSPAWYVNFAVSHSIELPKGVTLDLAGSVGYYYSDDDEFTEVNDGSEKYRTFHDGLISIGLTIPISDYCSVSPSVVYTFPLSDKARDLITAQSLSDKSSFLVAGITLSMAF